MSQQGLPISNSCPANLPNIKREYSGKHSSRVFSSSSRLYSPGLCAPQNVALYSVFLCSSPDCSIFAPVSVLHILTLKIVFSRRIVSQSPAIMHMLDKSGSCGKFESYQRPEGFPVGTCGSFTSKRGAEPQHISVTFFCTWRKKRLYFIRNPAQFVPEAEVRAMAKERQKKDNHNLSRFYLGLNCI